MEDPSPAQMQLLKMTEGLIRYRFDLARLAFSLVEAREETEDGWLRADLECAIVDHFDPLLRTILEAAGGPRGKLLEAALDLAGLRHRLDCLSESLPTSPEEDAMINGEIPTDVPTEMKLTLTAVVEDQLNLAYKNLLYAAGYDVKDQGFPSMVITANGAGTWKAPPPGEVESLSRPSASQTRAR